MNRGHTILAITAVGCLAAVLITGCSAETRQKILPIFFDGFSQGEPRPRPPTRRVRRDLLREIEELKRELADVRAAEKASQAAGPSEKKERPVEEADTWEEAAKFLPKDPAGGVDWVQALSAGTIAPRPGGDPKTPERAVMDMDVVLGSTPISSVRYPHAAHTQWLSCENCHPAIFPLRRQAEPTAITMAKIRKGEYCGVCHGGVAFGVEGRCARCHRAIPEKSAWRASGEPSKPIERATSWDEAAKLLPLTAGGPDWAKALAEGAIAPRPGIDPKAADEPIFPLDVELVPADNPTFKVVFPHGAHTALLSCTTCHPGIFQMAAGADPITMEKILVGEYCGRCHGKVAFAVPTGCPRCHPALAGS